MPASAGRGRQFVDKVTVKIRMLHEPIEVDADEAEVLRAQGLLEEEAPPPAPPAGRKAAAQASE
jgi:hypothetical protein